MHTCTNVTPCQIAQMEARIRILENEALEASERLRGASNHILNLSKQLGIEVTHDQTRDTGDRIRAVLFQQPTQDVRQIMVWGMQDFALRHFTFADNLNATEEDITNYWKNFLKDKK